MLLHIAEVYKIALVCTLKFTIFCLSLSDVFLAVNRTENGAQHKMLSKYNPLRFSCQLVRRYLLSNTCIWDTKASKSR